MRATRLCLSIIALGIFNDLDIGRINVRSVPIIVLKGVVLVYIPLMADDYFKGSTVGR